MMTAFKLRILLHYYSSPTDYPDRSMPIWNETIGELMNAGLVEYNPDEHGLYKRTDKLKCYIDYILELPLPEWSMTGV